MPRASLEKEGATLLCDPYPDQSDEDAGEALVVCSDGLELALRAFHTVVTQVDRVYLRRTPCRSTPCSPDELRYATVSAWAGETAWTIVIDGELGAVTMPVADAGASWPAPTTRETPPVDRPQFDGAPPVVRHRSPYPFCGNAYRGVNEYPDYEVMECFKSAVLAGRPAEMLDVFVIWRGIQVFRFDGQGPIVRYEEMPDGWYRDGGLLILGIREGLWDLDNVFGGTPLPKGRVPPTPDPGDGTY